MSAGAVFTFDEIIDLSKVAAKRGGDLKQADRVQLTATIRKDIESGLDKAESSAGAELLALRNGYQKTTEFDGNVVQSFVSGQQIDSDTFFKERYNLGLNDVLKFGFGINPKVTTFGQMVSLFGGIANVTFTTPQSTADVTGYRWLVPEVILAAVMRGMRKSGKSSEWIANTINTDQPDNIIMPQISGENFDVNELTEAMTMETGAINFADKIGFVKEYGKGFSITDRLRDRITIDAMQTALGFVGRKFSFKEELLALGALEQDTFVSKNPESAVVIGVEDTAKGFQEIDILRAVGALAGLGYDASTIIGTLTDITNINLLPIFRGFNGSKQEGSLEVNDSANINNLNLTSYARRLPSSANKIAIFDKNYALAKMNYKSMRVEPSRNAANKTSSTYASMYSGFAIQNIQSILVIDKSITYASNPLPSNYLIESYTNAQ